MKRVLAGILSAVCMTTMMVGCGDATTDDNGSDNKGASASDNQGATGTITMNGSTSMEKLCSALKESLAEEGITLEPQYTGSGAGIEAVTNGTTDIGNSSRALKEEEKDGGIVENIVAIDGIAVIVNPDSTVKNLTKEELIKVYTGEITKWSDLKGDDEPIVVIGREAGSGTRGAFEELLDVEDECAYAQEIDSTGGVVATVASTPGSIGYVSLDVIDDTVTALSLDDVEATEENIVAGDYFLSRPFVMATKGEISEQSEAVQALFTYLGTDAGKEVITSVGLVLPE